MNQNSKISFLKDERVSIVLGILILSIAGFLILSLTSFFFTWEFDMSELKQKTSWEILTSREKAQINNTETTSLEIEPSQIGIQNWGGKFGSIVSKVFIHDWFGVSSFLFIYIFIILGLKYLKIQIHFIRTKLFVTLTAILVGSIVLAYGFRDMWDANVGGFFGYFMSCIFLENLFGRITSGFIVLSLLIVFIIFSFPKSLQFFRKIFNPQTYKSEHSDTVIDTKLDTQLDDIQENNNQSEEFITEPFANSEETLSNNSNIEPIIETQPTERIIETYIPTTPIENDLNFEVKSTDTDNSFEKEYESEFNANEEYEPPFIMSTIADSPIEDAPKEAEDEVEFTSLTNTVEISKEATIINDFPNIPEEEIRNTITPIINESQLEEDNIEELGYDVPGLEITNTLDIDDEMEDLSHELHDYDPTLDLSHYELPSIDLLEQHQASVTEVSKEELSENKHKIEETLRQFGIGIKNISATIGPTITLYEIIPADGVRISKIKNLEDDIALSLAALGIRIIAPIPGKGTIGIEVPNKNPEIVSMRSIIASKTFQEAKMDLPVALGKTISNETYVFDLTKMPHLLVAGATGQGKSVGLNAIMTSLLYKKHPSQLKFVLIDPKKVELTLYQNIEKHFLAKLPDEEEAIITDTQKVIYTLNSLCLEMDNRYNLLKEAKLRNIKEYNERFIQRRLNPEKGHKYLPYIVVVIDEFADLIITAGREVEIPLARLAQLARAIGIHLIIATQRPAANIITGAIKANFPARLAFRVASGIDSRTILDSTGANQLIGKGDMLITKGSELVRVQCAFVDTPEVEKLTTFISEQQSYSSAFPLPEYKGPENTNTSFGSESNDLDALDAMFEEAAHMIVSNQQGSTSLLQRKLKLGYNRAGRIMDQLEAYGVVGPFEGSKARQVLISDETSLAQLLQSLREQGKLM